MAVIGIDVGTTGCKATLIDDSGEIGISRYIEYKANNSALGFQEIDPNHVWESVLFVTSQCVTEHNKKEKIAAISVSSLGEAVVPLNEKGEVLGAGILYTDPRGTKEITQLERRISRKRVMEISGIYPQKMYSLPKMMWMKKHLPEVYNQTKYFVPFDGFILFRLGAPVHTNYSLAARTMAFNVTEKKWSHEILDAAEVDSAKMPEAVMSGTVVGKISSELALKLGIDTDTLLVAGGYDQPCAALGSGAYLPGTASDGLGSVESITPIFDKPLLNEKMAEYGFACVPHIIKDMYVTYAMSYTAGRLFKWYRDTFAKHEILRAKAKGCSIYELLIDEMSDSITDLYMLPYLAGAATPYMDDDVRGAYIGLTLDTTPNDLIRAALEGITFESMVNIEHLRMAGIEVKQLKATGGMTQSDKYMQMKADMMGIEITTLECSEAGTLGAGILAAVAAGIYSNVDEAVKNVVKVGKTYMPDMNKHQDYKDKFQVYKSIYPAIKQIGGNKNGCK